MDSHLSIAMARLDELSAAEIEDKMEDRFALLKKRKLERDAELDVMEAAEKDRKADRDAKLKMTEAAAMHARSNKQAANRMKKLRAKAPTTAAPSVGEEHADYLRTADARIEAANKRAATAEAALDAYKNAALEDEEEDTPGTKGYSGDREGTEGEGSKGKEDMEE